MLLSMKLTPLDEGVPAIAVIALATPSGAEAAAGVETDGSFVVGSDFEGGVNGTVLACPLQQAKKKQLAVSLPAM